MSKARTYLAKAMQCGTAGAEGPLLSREWQLILARAYRMLAEAEGELASRRLSVAA
jgi:hypothetical protein